MNYSITDNTITVVVDGKTHTVRRGAPNFDLLRACLNDKDFDRASGFLTVKTAVEAWANGLFTISGNNGFRSGEALPESLSKRIMAMVTAGDNPQSLLNFWDRLQNNPSWRSVQQLWGFLANRGIPIDQDGYLLTYKAVNNNWTDCHSGTIKNVVGSVHEMARNKISDDPTEACHYGYHVGALDYAATFGPTDRKIIICKVDPADVVCIPNDCSMQKMRTCKYEVLGVHNGVHMSSTVINTREDPTLAKKPVVAPMMRPVAPAAVVSPAGVKTRKKRSDAGVPRGPKVAKPAAPVEVVEVAKAAEVVIPEVTVTGTEFHEFDNLDSLQLLDQPLAELRTYAATVLKIMGASKIPGGKAALVSKIVEVRE